MATNILGLMDYVQKQGDAGRKQGQETLFNKLAGQAYTAPAAQQSGLVGQMVGIDPTAGMAVDKQLQSNETDHNKKLRGAAQFALDALKSKDPARIQGAGNAVGPYLTQLTGKQFPGLSEDMLPALYQVLAQTSGDTQTGMPTGFREFEMTARAAGLQPGTPEYQRAARIALGSEGRASSAGIGFQKVTGADGRERIGRSNPRTGAFEVYNEQTGQFEPMGGPATGAPPAASIGPAITPQSPAMPNAAQQANAYLSQGMTPQQAAARVNADGGGVQRIQLAIDPATGQFRDVSDGSAQAPQANPGLAVSRSPEETAAATEAAKQRVGLEFLPRTEAIKTQAAIRQAGGSAEATEAAKAQSSFAQGYPQKLANANDMLSVLDKAITSPGRELMTGISGKIDPRAYMPGGRAAAFKAILDQINGKAFLEAYNTLKGGGQITEVEGQKATQAMARLNTAQSDEDFLAALKEFRGVVANGVQRLQQQSSQFSGQQPAQPAGDVDSLLSKYGVQ